MGGGVVYCEGPLGGGEHDCIGAGPLKFGLMRGLDTGCTPHIQGPEQTTKLADHPTQAVSSHVAIETIRL